MGSSKPQPDPEEPQGGEDKNMAIISTNSHSLLKLLEKIGLTEFDVSKFGLPFLRTEECRRDILDRIYKVELLKILKERRHLKDEKEFFEMSGAWDKLSDEQKKKYEISEIDPKACAATMRDIAASILDGMEFAFKDMKRKQHSTAGNGFDMFLSGE